LVVRGLDLFDINWSRKIKITINGKEYARLEDVPEEFRALLKDSDGDGIPDVAGKGRGRGDSRVSSASAARVSLWTRTGASRSPFPTAFNSTTTAWSGASRGAGSRGMP